MQSPLPAEGLSLPSFFTNVSVTHMGVKSETDQLMHLIMSATELTSDQIILVAKLFGIKTKTQMLPLLRVWLCGVSPLELVADLTVRGHIEKQRSIELIEALRPFFEQEIAPSEDEEI